jgi:hypothetical protein
MNDDDITDIGSGKANRFADTGDRPRRRRRRIYFGERVEPAFLIFIKVVFAVLFGMLGFVFGVLGGAILGRLFGQMEWEIVGGVVGGAIVGLAVLVQLCLPRR